MNTQRSKRSLITLLMLSLFALSACGTLEIDTEPVSSLTEATALVAEPTNIDTGTPPPTPTTEGADDGSTTVAPSEEDDETTIEVTPTPAEPLAEEELDETLQPETEPSEITVVDDTWFNYTNYQLGFSIDYPRTKIHFHGTCTWNEENGDHSYRYEYALVPVKTFEDVDTVYITSEYQHELTGETKETSEDGGTRTFFSECQAISNSLELLRDQEHYQEMWKIVVREVRNDEELDAFLKSRYGSGCSLGEKVSSNQDGVYDIKIQGDGNDWSESLCPLNYGTVVKYFPEGNKVIAWDTGQASTFAADAGNSVVHDQEMVDSFRFLTETSAEAGQSSSAKDGQNSSAYDYADWQIYANEALGYTLMHPSNSDVMGANPDGSVEFVGPMEGDEYWPWFFVSHFDSEFFRPSAGTDVRQWIADSNIPYEPLEDEMSLGGLAAVHFVYEASPQAYGRDEYYVINDGQLFQFTILHAGGLQDWALYEQFLDSIGFDQ
jgi:hypothetical protein